MWYIFVAIVRSRDTFFQRIAMLVCILLTYSFVVINYLKFVWLWFPNIT